ncbi:flagellar assembly protein FliH [Shewanella sp. CAL98-MNA-CIBAN-0140]|uniref:flagellar assembly protein FliH n=1 Tax=Shewanella sp. CAL98-MNA-CIBAN-0140 TaxID=3140462 RepID=UPI0033236B8A
MPESKSPKNTLNTDDEQAFRHWQLPDMTKDSSLEPSNMFGKFSEAHTPTPVAGAEKSMAPPTMAQIEDIRAAAEQEGLEQGKQEGHQQGLEQGRLEGLEQGHQQGFAQGEQQGLEAGQAKINQLVEQLNQIINQFERPLSILDNEIEAELLAMTISLAKSVIGHELKTHPEHILLALRQGVDALPLKEQRVKLRLNQADAEIVNQCYSAEQLDKNQWQIDIDPSLSNGDCIIESVRSSVDLRVEQRINQVFSELDAQSNQLAKNVQQQKATHPQYQTTSVDNLSEHQQPPELTDTIDSTNRADNDQNSQSHTVDTDAEPVTQHIDAPDPIVDPQTSATLDTSAQAETVPADKADDTVPTDKADDTQQQTKDLSQGNTDEHSSTSTT